MWKEFFLCQRQQRAARDRLSSAVLVAILCVVAYRLQRSESQQPWATPGELLHHMLLTGLAVFSVIEGGSPVYMAWRNIVVVALRLGTASSSVITKHAVRVLEVRGGPRH